VVCKGLETSEGVYDERKQKGVRIIEHTYDHFTIHKSVGSVDGWAAEFLLLRFLLVLSDGNHIGGVTIRSWIKEPVTRTSTAKGRSGDSM
jgi:hypothetical protein